VKRIDDDTGEWTINNVPRLLIDDMQPITDGLGDITYDDGTTSATFSDAALCYFILTGKTFNAGFNNSMLPDNYTALTRVLNQSRKLTLLFKLTELDMYNLDHFIPVYLSQFAAYFYVNKVLNWTGEGLTKVELIRIGTENTDLLG
jgi:hypothetical protein